jgi:tripartite-type tricarboxylate transporter receptor subunit TctC
MIHCLVRLILIVAVSISGSAQARNYPDRTVTIVVPYGPGGGTDMIARLMADGLRTRLHQSVIVENVPGAGGVIGSVKAANAPADGYTLLLGSGSEIEIIRMTDPESVQGKSISLSPVALIGTQPMIVVGNPGLLKADTIDELVEYAKGQAKPLRYGSAGIGTVLHFAGEAIQSAAGIRLDHVPYRGAGQLANDVVGGQIELAIMALPSALPLIRDHRLKAFGLTEAVRTPASPGLPALAESRSVKGIDLKIWYGLFAPAGVPEDVVSRLEKALSETLQQSEVQAKLLAAGVTVAAKPTAKALLETRDTQLAKFRSIAQDWKARR